MFFRLCDLGGIRTPNRRSRNPLFYPVELRSHFYIVFESDRIERFHLKFYHSLTLKRNLYASQNLRAQNFITFVRLIIGTQKIVSECENTEIFVNFILCR